MNEGRKVGAVGRKAFGRSVGGPSTAFEGCGGAAGRGREEGGGGPLLLLLLLLSLQAVARGGEAIMKDQI